jgi:hypothetical protein
VVTQGGQTCTSEVTIEVLPTETYYLDWDGDGYGNSEMLFTSCAGSTPEGYATVNGDCNDTDSLIFPMATCDDGDECTVGDVYQTDCTCAGILSDSDNDGICDFNDGCAGPEAGSACDDGNEQTINDVVLADCTCLGEFILEGCTNVLACNFNALATIDDGSCAFDSYADTTIGFTDSLVWNGQVYYAPGEYTYTITNMSGCDSVITLHLEIVLSLISIDSIDGLEIYPNPANDIITLDYGGYSTPHGYSVRIINNSGGLLYNKSLIQAQETLDISGWSSGVYQVVVYNAGGVPVETRQIVIQ